MSEPTERRVDPKLLAEIRRLQFSTRKLASAAVSGQYRSAFRGQGLEFEEIREYFPGDDIRQIDWKVTARSQRPFIKSYREERELTVMVALDVSSSTHTGTKVQLREKLASQLGAVLTLIAMENGDRVGLTTFSDQVESYFRPERRRGAVWRVFHEAFLSRSSGGGTNLSQLCLFLQRVLHRRSIVFLISDFADAGFEIPLSILAKRHDVTALVVTDPSEFRLPKVGLVSLRDPESGEELLVDTRDKEFRDHFAGLSRERCDALSKLFRRVGAGMVEVSTEKPFMPILRKYLESRRRGQLHLRGESSV